MGEKLIRDFAPGLRLARKKGINGTIRKANTDRERIRLGAEKVVEEVAELKDEVDAHLKMPGHPQVPLELKYELGDVYESLKYLAHHLGLDLEVCAALKAEKKGRFSQSFVWEWPDTAQPRTE